MIYSGRKLDAASVIVKRKYPSTEYDFIPVQSDRISFTIDGLPVDKNKCVSVRLGLNGYAEMVNGNEPRLDKHKKRFIYKRIRGHVKMVIL